MIGLHGHYHRFWHCHVFMTILYTFIFAFIVFFSLEQTAQSRHCKVQLLSSSSSWPSHVRNYPSCREQVGMLTF